MNEIKEIEKIIYNKIMSREERIYKLTNLINSHYIAKEKVDTPCDHNYVFDLQAGYTDESTNYDCREVIYHCTRCGNIIKKAVSEINKKVDDLVEDNK